MTGAGFETGSDMGAKRYILVIFFLLFSILFVPQHASAFLGRMNLLIRIPAEQKISSDLYLLGWRVTASGEVNGNLFVLGGTVRVHGPVHGNVYLAGGSVEIDGPVDGDINLIAFTADSHTHSRACRILAGDASHEGKTTLDLLALGGMVGTQDTVGGDTLLGGWWVNVGGRHAGNLLGIAHNMVMSGSVGGNAELKADVVTFEDSAAFDGNLTYTSPHEMDLPGTQVKGTLIHNFPSPHLPPEFHLPWLYIVSHRMFSALWLTVVGLVSLFWFPRSSQSVVDTMLHFPWESFFTGLALMIALPGAAFVLLVSFLGIPLGIFLFAVFGVAVYLTRLFGSLYIGERILGALEHHMPPYWQSLPLGVFLFTVLTSIPYLGLAVSLVVIPLALGAKAILGWRVYRRMRHRHLA